MLNLGAVWGLDVGDSALKAVKLKRMGNKVALLDFQIIRYGELADEPGARRENRLAEAIAALQAAGLGRDRCMASIAPQAVFSRFISLPPVDKRRIPEIVLYEARQQIPFSLNEVVWAYESVRKDFVPGEEIEIGLFAVKREVIAAYLAEMNAIRQRLHGIQVAPLALYNFIRHEMTIEQPIVVVDIGAQSTDLLIIEGNKFWLRNLPIAGNTFTSTLEKRLNIPRAEAEKLKLEIAENRQRRKIMEVLRPTMRDLVAEIQRSVGYYKSLSQSVKFEEVVVTGEGVRLFGLDRFLAEQLQYKITPLDQLKNIVYQGPQERAHELGKNLTGLGVAIGLALQGLGRGRATVDLLPDDFVIQRELHAKRYSAAVAALLVWATVLSFYSKEKSTLTQMERFASTADRTLAEADRRKAEYNRYKAGDDPRITTFRAFGRHREYDAQVIKALAEVVPRDIRIDDGFTFTHGGSGQSGVEGGGDRGGGAPPGGSRPPGMPDRSRGAPGGERGAAAQGSEGASGEESKLAAAKLVLTFTASCDESMFDSALKVKLPKHIYEAKVYWQQVPIVSGVVVGAVQVRTVTAPDPMGPGTIQQTELYAPVSVGLRTADEADVELKNMIDKAQKDAEEAAAKAAAEQATRAADGSAATTAPAAPAEAPGRPVNARTPPR